MSIFLYNVMYSKKPIVADLQQMANQNKLPKKVVVVYGEYDWMDKEHSKWEILARGLSSQVDYRTVAYSGHNIMFAQPVRLARLIVEDIGIKFREVKTASYIRQSGLLIIDGPSKNRFV